MNWAEDSGDCLFMFSSFLSGWRSVAGLTCNTEKREEQNSFVLGFKKKHVNIWFDSNIIKTSPVHFRTKPQPRSSQSKTFSTSLQLYFMSINEWTRHSWQALSPICCYILLKEQTLHNIVTQSPVHVIMTQLDYPPTVQTAKGIDRGNGFQNYRKKSPMGRWRRSNHIMTVDLYLRAF